MQKAWFPTLPMARSADPAGSLRCDNALSTAFARLTADWYEDRIALLGGAVVGLRSKA